MKATKEMMLIIYIRAFIIFSILGVLAQYSTSNFFEKEK